ncbi:putative aminohydrolase SsnA [Clostridium sp. YIM B02515]|uniref:Aminohydrolase SsnA n=1 Tax=Clostridium rhizosphaerae TaxID=2803861 RepID=A0ABS1TGQ7_9CLOT|nr:putative aminohydrolase SsnA [Clostridium rhizosphaerae]MBL4938262.1 putative aminohydrolase SsnA [Clostridium rhizosphaerae]
MLIKNAKIFTFDNEDRFIEKGFVLVREGLIQKIASMEEFKEEEYIYEKEIIDAEGKLLFPGFICTHTHIYSAFARGMSLKGSSASNFLEILKDLWWRLDKKLSYEDIYYSALVTLIESVKSGFTCLFDHHASPFSVEGSLDFIEKAFRQIGVRGSLCYEVSDRDGKEIARQGIKENVRFIKKNIEDDMVKGIFGLHASFTLSNETLKLCSEEGNSLGSGFHIHAAEGMEDYEQCRRSYGKGVTERLSDYSIVGNKSILAHCIHVKEKELDLLKKTNVVHNPESNMNNAVGYCDAAKMMSKGITVGLGSDGFNSNPFRAMECCYVLHKHEIGDPRVMTPDDVIKLSVKNNSKITSKFFKNEVGVLREGAKADMIMLDYDSPTPITRDNVCGHIIFGMNSLNVIDSIINGRFVMKNRILQGVEEEDIFQKSRELSEKLWERF